MFFKGMIGAAAAMSVFMSTMPAMAQSPIANPTGLVSNYNISAVESLLTEIGVPFERRTREDSVQYLLANIDGLNLILRPQACDAIACDGLEMIAFFTDFSASAQAMNIFNREYKPVRVFLDSQGRTFFSRYMIGDYGYTRGSFFVNLAVFSQSPRVFLDNFPPQGASPNALPPTANQISGDAEPIKAMPLKMYEPGEVAPTDEEAEQLNALQMTALKKAENFGATPDAQTTHNFEYAASFREFAVEETGWPSALGNKVQN
ncbi:MAG: YbjN domain-containing protein [Pseudomonadota bacterium]